jgi:hypothetical protein
MKKCELCQLELQDKDDTLINYTPNLNLQYCKNCFSVINYNKEIIAYSIDTDEVIPSTDQLCLFVISFMDLPLFLKNFTKYDYLENKLLVITKFELYEHLFNYKELSLKLSSYFIKRKYIDAYLIRNDVDRRYLSLYFNHYKEVLFYGYPNSGKTTLIYHYTNLDKSILKPLAFSTKAHSIHPYNHYQLIDHQSMKADAFYLEFSYNEFSSLFIKNKITTNHFNLIGNQALLIERLYLIELISKDVNISSYLYENIKVKKIPSIKTEYYLSNVIFGLVSKAKRVERIIIVHKDEQLFVSNFGILQFNKEAKIKISYPEGYEIDTLKLI